LELFPAFAFIFFCNTLPFQRRKSLNKKRIPALSGLTLTLHMNATASESWKNKAKSGFKNFRKAGIDSNILKEYRQCSININLRESYLP
jgi:hypothetical protein